MKKKLLAAAMACAFMFAAIGCSKSGKQEENSQKNNADTRVVKDANGEVTIPVEPKRIVDFSGYSDVFALLGYNVVGTCNSSGYDYTKLVSYLEDTLKNVEVLGYSMSDSVDIESVIGLEPDLIVISQAQQKSYDQLSEIAPTVMVSVEQTDMKKDIMKIAKIMDKEAKMQQWIDEYEKDAKKLGEEIKAINGEDATYLSFLSSDGSVFIYDTAGLGNFMYQDLGLKRPENLPNQDNVQLPVVTFEGLSEIGADYFAVTGTEEYNKKLEQDPVWKSMETVKLGHYKMLPANPYFNQGYSPVGRQKLLEEIRTFIDENK